MDIGETYEILLIVEKDTRESRTTLTVEIVAEDVSNVVIK